MAGINKTVSAENDATTLDGTELTRIVQGGASVKTTLQNIANLAPPAPLTTKGDLLGYGTGLTRIPVGPNGDYALTADSSQTLGVKWGGPYTRNVDLADTTDGTKGAGRVGFLYSLTYTAGTIGAWLKSLAAASGSTFIGFEQPGTGAVVRTVQSKLQELISVLDFGAVGDGVTDDTTAIQNAINSGGSIVVPAGKTYLIRNYINIPSNTTLTILGTIKIASRNGGFYANNASNISIFGCKEGTFTDAAVTAAYAWNPATVVAPAIHLRSVDNCKVEGLNFTYVRQGVLISNATANTSFAGSWSLTQAAPTNVVVRDCKMTMCEGSGLSCYSGVDVTYERNYVYRCGDGGLWMMGCIRCGIINNTRLSPQTTAADVATYGANVLAHPTTWNDEQGIELENCHSVLVQGNRVSFFAYLPIDVKNNCSEIEIVDNFIYGCESTGICVREGDSVKNSVHRVSIRGNQIFNQGTSQYGILNPSYKGGICVSECYLAEISGNTINSWQSVPAISANGPGAYLSSQYPGNPFQAAVTISNNQCWFKNNFQEIVPSLQATATTPSAIIAQGFYDSVSIVGNLVKADRFSSGDSRISATPAIYLTYTLSAAGYYYPNSANISTNTISNWIGRGIDVYGYTTQSNCGCTITGNNISGVANIGIHSTSGMGLIVNGNSVKNVGAGAGNAAIQIETPGGGNPVYGVSVSNNSIYGRQDGGTNTMTYGIYLDTCSGIVSGNDIRDAVTATTNFINSAGEIKVVNTDGFPRSGSATPIGAIYPLFIGEDYYSTGLGKWFKSTAIGSTSAWTQTSN